MMKNVNQMGERGAFTIVELLTVMAVIAILIGLLVPALGLVHDTAKDLQQRAQFHGIEVGLELYKTEFGNYPESDDNAFAPDGSATGELTYSGANKLAEAMVGQDMMGYHPSSEFRADGQGPDPVTGVVGDLYDQTTLDDRSDRFIDSGKANAFKLAEIYDPITPFSTTYDNYVLCDVYAKQRMVSTKKSGMPVLYYRADTKYKIQDSDPDFAVSIYDYHDNDNILRLGMPDESTFQHLIYSGFVDGLLNFDEAIINPQNDYKVPYKSQSFILISAGKDGVYGNADDIYNFEKQE